MSWASLEQLHNCFNLKHSDMICSYELDPGRLLYEKPNCVINTDRLFPLRNHNKYKQGLGKGHWLAIKHLLRTEGFAN